MEMLALLLAVLGAMTLAGYVPIPLGFETVATVLSLFAVAPATIAALVIVGFVVLWTVDRFAAWFRNR
jgi:hypothetical protein